MHTNIENQLKKQGENPIRAQSLMERRKPAERIALEEIDSKQIPASPAIPSMVSSFRNTRNTVLL